MIPITDTFTFDRTLPLPPDRMWTLLTDSTMREIWGAPGDATLETLTSDLRLGGLERHRCGPADNPEFEVETRWYNLDQPHAATFTEVIEADGHRLGASLVTYQIDASGSGSDVAITVAVVSFVGPEMIANFKEGWTGSVANLEALAAEQ